MERETSFVRVMFRVFSTSIFSLLTYFMPQSDTLSKECILKIEDFVQIII